MFSSIITADLHFDEKIVKEGLPLKLATFIEEQRILHKSQVLFILGDFFDKHLDPQRRIRFIVLDAIAEFFHTMQFDEIIILKGNHDESFISFHNLKILTLDSRVKIIDTPSILNFPNMPKIFAIPFYKEHEVFYSALDQAPEECIVFMHQAINGFRLNAKKVCDMGINIKKKFPVVISGDFHDHQSIGSVIYVGSPYQTARNESPDKYLLCLSEGNLDAIKIPSSVSKRFIFVDDLSQVEDIENVKGKTIVITNENIDLDKLKELQDKGINVISTKAIMKDSIPKIEVDLSSFSTGLLNSIVEQSDDPFMKAVGNDLMERIKV
jgi:hypothetical protein